jgi:hypothetical protein
MNSFWPLVHYFRPHWRGLAFVAASMVLLVGLDVLRPWPTKILVDQVLGQQPLTGPLENLPPSWREAKGLLLAACLATVLSCHGFDLCRAGGRGHGECRGVCHAGPANGL